MPKKYISENAELMKEWDWERNKDLDPSKLTVGSNKKVWWKCDLKHEFQMPIKQKKSGVSCPYCSNRKILIGYNDLQTTHPQLLKEWHPIKNTGLSPTNYKASSSVKIWWKCAKCGYEWKTAIEKRAIRKHGCLNCTNQVTVSGVNDLATLYPKVAKEWPPIKNGFLTPKDIRPKSNRKYWWKCVKCGHEWQVSAQSRIHLKSGCPACSGRVVRTRVTDLFTVYPHLEQEWNFGKNKHLDPSRLSRGSNAKAWWKCKLGHEYEMTIHRKSAGAGCPYCTSHRVLTGFNDFKTAFPELAKEWDTQKNEGKSPDKCAAHSNQKVWWLCSKGHSYEMAVNHRATGGNSPYCSNHKLLVGYNDLKTLYPELTNEWDYEKNSPIKPTDIIPKTKKKVWWKCPTCSHSWKASIIDRVYGTKCPKCAPKRRVNTFRRNLIKKENCLKDPILLKEWNYEKNVGLSPEYYTAHSNQKVWWKCAQGHEYQATIDKRFSGQGCPICSNHRLLTGFNDLQTKFPNIAKEWNFEKNGGVEPSQIIATSTKKAWWICSVCHTNWQAKIQSRTIKQSGCPKCSVKKRVEAHREAFIKKNGCITDPLLLQEWNYAKNNPLTPQDFPPVSNKFAWWTCSKCGYEWKAKIANRSLLKRGCPCCANHVVVKGKNDFATTHPQLAKEWHPSKNAFTPDTIPYGTRKKVWWICPKGHEYTASVLHRSHGTNCPICNSGRQTSFSEQAIYYYVRKIFPDAINRYKDIFSNGMELDIYIPSIKTAVEYDGVFYHKSIKLQREMKKYEICRKHNIKLIRIKEADITKDKEQSKTADFVFHVPGLGDTKKALDKTIQILLSEMTSKTALFPTYVYASVDVNTERDKYEIRKYMTDLKGSSLADLRPDLAKEWHPTKNGHFKPSMVSIGANRKAWWLCRICGHEWEATVGHRVNGTGCPKCGIKKNTQALQKAVEMLDPNTNDVIQEFASISEAGRKMKINHSNIGTVCKGIRPKAGGYKWRYKS